MNWLVVLNQNDSLSESKLIQSYHELVGCFKQKRLIVREQINSEFFDSDPDPVTRF
jgi:hypothetical protein